MRKQIILQLKSVNKLKVIFTLKKCCACNKFLEYSGRRVGGGGGGSRSSNEPPLEVNDGGLKTLKVCFPYIVIHTGLWPQKVAFRSQKYSARGKLMLIYDQARDLVKVQEMFYKTRRVLQGISEQKLNPPSSPAALSLY